MEVTPSGFEAFLFHPDLGNEMVVGVILVDPYTLRFRSESILESVSMDSVEVEFFKDRIYFNDPNRPELKIYTSDSSILNHPAFRQSHNVRSQVAEVLGGRELRRVIRVTVYFIIGCVLVIWLGSLAMSGMVRAVAARVPLEWQQKFGQAEIDELGKGGELAEDTNQIAQLTALAAPLIQALPANRRNLKFYIRNDPSPNAFALPGGYVVVHTGLLQMADEPEELLGVLAHEIAHETQRHVIRQQIAAAGPVVIFGVFLHSRSGAGNLLTLGSGLMIYQGFSQAYETEADEVGWKYLVAANIDPRGMTRLFKKLKAYEDQIETGSFLPHAFDSHPALAKRIARLEAKWKKLGRQSGFLEIPPVTWSIATNSLDSLLLKLRAVQP